MALISFFRCPKWTMEGEWKFWFNANHCVFWLDYYLTLEPANLLRRGRFAF